MACLADLHIALRRVEEAMRGHKDKLYQEKANQGKAISDRHVHPLNSSQVAWGLRSTKTGFTDLHVGLNLFFFPARCISPRLPPTFFQDHKVPILAHFPFKSRQLPSISLCVSRSVTFAPSTSTPVMGRCSSGTTQSVSGSARRNVIKTSR